MIFATQLALLPLADTVRRHRLAFTASLTLAGLLAPGCLSPLPEGLAEAPPARTTVKMDFEHRPLPEIPLPNDIATRYDRSSATGRRVNASMVAPTGMERRVRRNIDQLDGWGTFQPITIPFTGPIDIGSLLEGHRDPDYDPRNDAVYVIDVDPDSPRYGKLYAVDVGNGNYPVLLERFDNYWDNDPRRRANNILFEEVEEDRNGNGVLDPGEDSDGDGVLDHPNYLPGAAPDPADLAGRADALMSFYERETDTLIVRTLEPLDERTTYAVVVTRRIRDADGAPVGSPYRYINHAAQTEALEPLLEVLPEGLALADIAYTFSFTTQTIQSGWIAVRDGLYGHGVQKALGRDFPARVDELMVLRDRATFPAPANVRLIPGEVWKDAIYRVRTEFESSDPDEESFKIMLQGIDAIDFVVIGSFQSPQLFPRADAAGRWLPFDAQKWPEDLDRAVAPTRAETVYFTLTVPRREISARGQGQPAPLVFQGHGYSSNRFEGLGFAGYFARHGLATVAIDAPSHGLPLTLVERNKATDLLEEQGLAPMAEALFRDRGYNQDADPLGKIDSGADFWTAYLFHTRDVVRQYALDFMQLARVMRSFDGQRRWALDVNEDGAPELAGDFDADGLIDVGGDAPFTMVGGSLGGMISMFAGALEPEITAIAPISGGGGLADIGIRTTQGGARHAFVLRAMGPFVTGTLEADGGFKLEALVNYINEEDALHFATVHGVVRGDTLVVENLDNGERGCGLVDGEGRTRASIPCNKGDRLRVLIYAGPALAGDDACGVRSGARLRALVDTFQREVLFEFTPEGDYVVYPEGSPLVALAEGLGLQRASPGLRRLQGLGQMVLDPGDMVNVARHLFHAPLRYPGRGQTSATHALVITTLGDTAVPPNTGMAYGRAAGLIDYTHVDPRYGVPPNQVLLDHYVAEGVNTYRRYTDPAGNGVHLDIENFSRGQDIWGTDIPRLDPPLRLGLGAPDPLGGMSAAIFPLPTPEGEHGFPGPGELTDKARRRCRNACTEVGDDPCGCSTVQTFDVGNFLFNMIGRYLKANGASISTDPCMSSNDCPELRTMPAPRPVAQQP